MSPRRTDVQVPRWCLALMVILGVVALSHLLIHVRTFGGDPEIHLVFARHAARGSWFAFNPGVHTSGQTSPLYMLTLAGSVTLLGEPLTAALMKALGVVSAVGLLVEIGRAGARAKGPPHLVACFALALAAMPSFFFQAQLGMENMPFAWLVAWLMRRWLDGDASPRYAAAYTLLACASFLWRPEAVFVLTFAAARALSTPRERTAIAVSGLIGGILVASVVWAIESSTGAPLHGAGLSRAWTSSLDAVPLAAGLTLHPKVLVFIAYAWPLAPLVLGGQRARLEDAALVCVVALPLGLHAFGVLPSTHFTRYVLYLWAVVGVVTTRRMAHHPTPTRWIVVFAMNVLMLGALEVDQRIKRRAFSNDLFERTLEALEPGARASSSDALCRQIECDATPVVVAAQEVQVRLRLDERFHVRSLDGVVDHGLLEHRAQAGGLDLVAYLDHTHVDIVLEFPSHGPVDDTALTLPELRRAALRGPCWHRGAVYTFVELEWLHYTHALLRTPSPERASHSECSAQDPH